MTSKYALRFAAPRLPGGDPDRADPDDACGAPFEDGWTPPGRAIDDPDTISAFKLTLMVTAIAVIVNTVFGIVCALVIVRGEIRGRGFLNAFVDLPLSLSPVVVGLRARPRSTARRAGSAGSSGTVTRFSSRRRRSSSPRSSSRCRSSCARSFRPCARSATEQEQAAQTLGANGLADVLAHHAAVDPVGGHLRRRPHGGPRDRRVRRGCGRGRPLRGPDADGHAAGRGRATSSRTTYAGAYGIAFVLAATAVIVLVAMIFLHPKESRS